MLNKLSMCPSAYVLCPGHYLCKRPSASDETETVCIVNQLVCDGVSDCVLVDDETFCGMLLITFDGVITKVT